MTMKELENKRSKTYNIRLLWHCNCDLGLISKALFGLDTSFKSDLPNITLSFLLFLVLLDFISSLPSQKTHKYQLIKIL